jgi:hypothetical protein
MNTSISSRTSHALGEGADDQATGNCRKGTLEDDVGQYSEMTTPLEKVAATESTVMPFQEQLVEHVPKKPPPSVKATE